jgi:hypothetical protein
MPLYRLIEAHVLSAERLHGGDTTVPILANGKTVTGRIWTYIRDDWPFGGTSPPAALYYASRDRRGEHSERHLRAFTGILQADAYSGFNALYDAARKPKPITPALCWAHSRRQFFELADIAKNARRGRTATAISPVALEGSSASIPCSIASATLTGYPPRSASPCARKGARRCWPS